MLRPFKILNEKDAAAFDLPPQFSANERKQFFYQTAALQQLFAAGKVRGKINTAHFLLAFGYFKAARRFYAQSHARDRAFVARALQIEPERFEQAEYLDATRKIHQQLILEHFGCRAFDKKARQLVVNEIRIASRSQIRPQPLFAQIVELIAKSGYAAPSYQTLAKLIAAGYNQHKADLVQRVDESLAPADRDTLQALFDKQGDTSSYSRYQITLLKRFSQSTRPSSIQNNIQDLLVLKDLYRIAQPVLKQLDLSHDGIRQYATAVIKSEAFQIHRREENDRFLHVIAFVAHQYWRLQDILVDTLLAAVTAAINSIEKRARKVYYEERKARTRNVLKLVNHANQWLSEKQAIQHIVAADNLTDEEKIEAIAAIVAMPDADQTAAKADINTVQRDNAAAQNNTYLLDFLEERSRKLQNRVSDILKHLTFSTDTTKPDLLAAVLHYQRCDGRITAKAPTDFLQDFERKYLTQEDGTFRTSLYKALLFQAVCGAIKSGALNIDNSYKYRSLDAYQIPKQLFLDSRDFYLEQAEMTQYADFWEAFRSLEEELDKQFHQSNFHLQSGDNDYVRPNGMGGYRISYARQEVPEEESKPTRDLYPKKTFVSLSEVLSTVHGVTRCLDAFEHWQYKYVKQRPADNIFCAGIQGLGCQIGTPRIAKISKQIEESTLENTINWYFSVDNARNANNLVLQFIDQMQLPRVYQGDTTHTSSDGQKYVVSDDSLNANYSFKYGGKEKVVSEYTFVDNRNLFFHSNVISGSEREAHYMIDGLMHNDVVKSDIHSTDTHGYSEAIFGSTFLLGITFAPRIKNVHK